MLDYVVYDMEKLGSIIKRERLHRGLSQAQLALRAGTDQSSLSRIESGREDVTWARLRAVLLSMGLEPELGLRPVEHGEDPVHVAMARRLRPSQRLEGGLNVAEFARDLREAAGSAKTRS